MTFEYRDADGGHLSVSPLPGVPYVLVRTDPEGCAVPADLVPDMVAGIRDTTRTAAARQTTGQDDTDTIGLCGYCGVPRENHHHGYTSTADAIAASPYSRTTEEAPEPDPTTADDPVQLRWGHGDVLHSDDDTVTVCLSGPNREPYWLELEPERAAALRDDLAAPAVGQPAEPRPPAVACGQCGAPWSDSHGIHAGDTCKPIPAVGQPAEAQPADEARPPREEWRIELLDVDGWMPSGLVRPDRELAAQYLAGRRKQRPDATFRLVRETTTWTVEDER